MKEIYLIEKAWIDPSENREAHGYNLYSFCETEKEAKSFCEKNGHYTEKDCWSIEYLPNKKLMKYRYTVIARLSQDHEPS